VFPYASTKWSIAVALTLQPAILDGASHRGSVRGRLSVNPKAEVIVNDVIDVEYLPVCVAQELTSSSSRGFVLRENTTAREDLAGKHQWSLVTVRMYPAPGQYAVDFRWMLSCPKRDPLIDGLMMEMPFSLASRNCPTPTSPNAVVRGAV
jgi:hypothetical protein